MSILYRFRDKAGYLSKVADFDHPTFGALVGGDPGRISRVIVRFAVLVELRPVTDTDGQTQTDRHRPMASASDA